MSLEINKNNVCEWISLADAFYRFVSYKGKTQSQEHIKPLHWYIACRLVLEGGFHPDIITPHPPFIVKTHKRKHYLIYDESSASGSERTILGGLKTKKVDVVASLDGIGPVLAVSCKGMTGALRNLSNRMEETIGECTNIHITYPAMVFGYFFVLTAHRQFKNATASKYSNESIKPNDIALIDDNPVPSVIQFHSALSELTGRQGVRNDFSRYESVCLSLVESRGDRVGKLFPDYPTASSPLKMNDFFSILYQRYEERYVYGAPSMKTSTRRLEWSPDSPVFDDSKQCSEKLDFEPRIDVD